MNIYEFIENSKNLKLQNDEKIMNERRLIEQAQIRLIEEAKNPSPEFIEFVEKYVYPKMRYDVSSQSMILPTIKINSSDDMMEVEYRFKKISICLLKAYLELRFPNLKFKKVDHLDYSPDGRDEYHYHISIPMSDIENYKSKSLSKTRNNF